MSLPFVVARDAHDDLPLFVGLEGNDLVGISVPGGESFTLDAQEVIAVVSADPAAVFWGLNLEWYQAHQRRAAEAPRRAPSYAPRGSRFNPLDLPMTGFPSETLLRHRMMVPSVDTIRLSSLFAVSTVRTSIEEAERSFNCFVELYRARGRELPDVADIRNCFRGLQNTKSRMFHEVAEYAPVIQDAVSAGLRDRELRRFLVRETDLPVGLGVAKASFTLALLGHDCVCLDARLLNRMFGSPKGALEIESGWGKTGRRVSELSLRRYEKVEDAFLAKNPFYDAGSPIGRARAQWMSWESVGRQAATHSVWLNVVTQ
jgi:hypothetical protein